MKMFKRKTDREKANTNLACAMVDLVDAGQNLRDAGDNQLAIQAERLGSEVFRIMEANSHRQVDGGYVFSLPKNGHQMSVAEFKECVTGRLFLDYDGHAIPVKGDKCDQRQIIRPSNVDDIPADATSVIWFNR